MRTSLVFLRIHESAHQRNRRTRFTILRFDYKADE